MKPLLLALALSGLASAQIEPCALISAAEVTRILGTGVQAGQRGQEPGADEVTTRTESLTLNCGYLFTPSTLKSTKPTPRQMPDLVMLGVEQANPTYDTAQFGGGFNAAQTFAGGSRGLAGGLAHGPVPGLPGGLFRALRLSTGQITAQVLFQKGDVLGHVVVVGIAPVQAAVDRANALAKLLASRLP